MSVAYYIGRSLFRTAFRFYFGWQVFDAGRVPRTGPVILASNHASFLDPPLVGSAVKRGCSILARVTLFRNPVFGGILRAVDAVPVDRDGGSAAGLKTILEKLAEGRAIVLFPEGTRTADGNLQPARSGIGLMAMKSGAPVVPVRVFGTFEAFGRQRRFPRRHRLIVKFGHPLLFEKQRAELNTCSRERLKAIYQEVAEEIMAGIATLEPGPD